MYDVLRTALLVRVFVGRVEARAGVGRDVGRDGWLDPLPAPGELLPEAAQGLPGQVLHDQVQLAVVLPQLLHLHHVRVADACDDPRLVEEHGAELLLLRQVGEHPLEDHGPLKAARPQQLSEDDLGHAPGGELPQDLIPTDPFGYARVIDHDSPWPQRYI